MAAPGRGENRSKNLPHLHIVLDSMSTQKRNKYKCVVRLNGSVVCLRAAPCTDQRRICKCEAGVVILTSWCLLPNDCIDDVSHDAADVRENEPMSNVWVHVVYAEVSQRWWRHIRWPADSTLRHFAGGRFRCLCYVDQPSDVPAVLER